MDISAVIITYNEEKNLSRCLSSLQHIVKEIVIVDSYSTDKTEEIASRFQARFIRNKFEGHIEQKNFAITQAKYDIILSLDADEALSDTLADSIKKLEHLTEYQACSMNRLTNYCGSWIKHSGWYPDTKVRLFHKKTAHWGGVNPHDKIVLKPSVTIQKLQGDLLHYSYHSISQHLLQLDKFTQIAAEELVKQGKGRQSFWKMIFTPPFTFIKNYFFKLGILDGSAGFIVCSLAAYNRLAKYAKAYTLYKNTPLT